MLLCHCEVYFLPSSHVCLFLAHAHYPIPVWPICFKLHKRVDTDTMYVLPIKVQVTFFHNVSHMYGRLAHSIDCI